MSAGLPEDLALRSLSSVTVQSDDCDREDTERRVGNQTCASDQLTEDDVKRKPWKYIGIRGYADFVASDDDFFVLRRFNSLNARVALALQDEISSLEEALVALDERYSRKSGDDIHNGTFRGDQEDRIEVIETLSKKLKRYNDFVLQQSQMRKYSPAPRRNIKSLRNWHYNYDKRAIAEAEFEYLNHDKDLINVVQKDRTPLRRLIDSSFRLRTLTFWKETDEQGPSYDDQVAYYSDKRMDSFVSVVIVAVGFAMLITPIWVLQALDSFQSKLIVITIFISACLLVVSSMMATRPFEALAATAGYVCLETSGTVSTSTLLIVVAMPRFLWFLFKWNHDRHTGLLGRQSCVAGAPVGRFQIASHLEVPYMNLLVQEIPGSCQR